MSIRTAASIASYVVPPAVAIAALLALWELYIEWRDISIIVVPPPSAVAERFLDNPDFFWREGLYTLYEATLGLALGAVIAVGLAVLMAHSVRAERALFPLAIILKSTPLVAVAPVLVIALGFGTAPKVIVAALLSFFPLLVNAMTGFRDVNPGALQFLRSLNASPWQVFWKLRAVSALPYVLAALKISYPLALIGAVVGEWFTGNDGLGVVIFRAHANLDTPTLFAATGVLAVTGITVNILLSLAERRLLYWHPSIRSVG
jgi:NitT/TauT family transport system permease protein